MKNILPPRGQNKPEGVMNEAQRRKLLARARHHGLDPLRDLPALVARLLPGQTLDALGGDSELDLILEALPAAAAELRARADSTLEPLELYEMVRDRRGYDGSWGNAVASFRCRAANVLQPGAPLADFLSWAARCADLPDGFRVELARQAGLGQGAP